MLLGERRFVSGQLAVYQGAEALETIRAGHVNLLSVSRRRGRRQDGRVLERDATLQFRLGHQRLR